MLPLLMFLAGAAAIRYCTQRSSEEASPTTSDLASEDEGSSNWTPEGWKICPNCYKKHSGYMCFCRFEAKSVVTTYSISQRSELTEADRASHGLYFFMRGKEGYLGHLSSGESILDYYTRKLRDSEAQRAELHEKGRQIVQDGMSRAYDVYSYDRGPWHVND